MPQPLIRLAQASDAAELARLNALFNGSREPPESYALRISDPRRVDTPILAELEGHVVGLVNLRLLAPVFYAEPYAEVTEMFVEETYRRRGIGSALMAFAEELARQAGAEEILVLTDFYNHPAQQLYRALGYIHHDLALSKPLS